MNKFKHFQLDISDIKNYYYKFFYNPHLRRIIALFLILLGVIQLWMNYHQSEASVVIARTTLYPGVPINSMMLTTRKLPAQHLPDTILMNPHSLEHKYPMVPILPGEFIFRSQLLDHIQAEQYLPAETQPRIVPIPIHDPSLVRAIQPGQIVDIIGKKSESTMQKHGEILARNAVIVTVVDAETNHGNSESLVYLALTQVDAEKTAENTAELGFIFH